jgi:cob(I)alamin adenosyltransferase
MYFTGKGDKGKTEVNKKKLEKNSFIFEVLGDLDELNSLIGLAKNYLPKIFFKKLTKIQNDIFIIQANVAYYLLNISSNAASENSTFYGKRQNGDTKFNLPDLKEERINSLEKEITEIERKIKSQKSFIIYGCDKDSAWFDYLRAIIRRVERRLVEFYTRIKTNKKQIKTGKNNQGKSNFLNILRYINRLSSYFYALARFICYNKKIKEESPWY